MKIRLITIPFFLACMLCSFTLLSQSSENTIADPIATGQEPVKQFIILRLKISKNENQYHARLVAVKTNPGIYKSTKEKSSNGKEGDVVCILLNEQRQPMDEMIIDNPFSIRLEYPNDNGTIGSTISDLTETEVMLRFNYTAPVKYLLVKKITKEGIRETITTLPIDLH